MVGFLAGCCTLLELFERTVERPVELSDTSIELLPYTGLTNLLNALPGFSEESIDIRFKCYLDW